MYSIEEWQTIDQIETMLISLYDYAQIVMTNFILDEEKIIETILFII